jgi:hypothetical protein
VFILTANGLSGAVLDVVTDGLICINSRLDPVHGSSDLWTYAWIMQGLGGFSGCILGGYLCSVGYCRLCFGLVSFVGLCVMIAGLMIDKKKEQLLDTTSNLTIR